MSSIVRRVPSFSAWLVLFGFLACPSQAAADDSAAACAQLPPNIQVHEFLKPAVQELLCKSQTFRRQSARIGAAANVRVTLIAVPPPRQWSGARATTTIARFTYGLMRAVVEIPLPSEQNELIAHELEHVIEQIEGVDLAALARAGDRRVYSLAGGVFETPRAQAAGRAAAREVLGPLDPAVAGAARGMGQLWRGITQRGAAPERPQP